jgi:hypothetical protein
MAVLRASCRVRSLRAADESHADPPAPGRNSIPRGVVLLAREAWHVVNRSSSPTCYGSGVGDDCTATDLRVRVGVTGSGDRLVERDAWHVLSRSSSPTCYGSGVGADCAATDLRVRVGVTGSGDRLVERDAALRERLLDR